MLYIYYRSIADNVSGVYDVCPQGKCAEGRGAQAMPHIPRVIGMCPASHRYGISRKHGCYRHFIQLLLLLDNLPYSKNFTEGYTLWTPAKATLLRSTKDVRMVLSKSKM